jgi:menaquinone-specific isochorismate synthase
VVRAFTTVAPAVVRTVALDGPVDLLAVAGNDGFVLERDGIGLAGRGVALRVALPGGLSSVSDVAAALASLECDDAIGRPGCGPVAIGALPFSPDTPSAVVVPSIVVGTDAQGSWVTTIGRPTDDTTDQEAAVPEAFSLTPTLRHADWCALVARAVTDIRAGHLDKVVLAREVLVKADRSIDVRAVLERLRSLYPSCLVFSIDGFLGASPELLVSRRGSVVRSFPLAGTIPRSGDPGTDEHLSAALLGSAKDRAEHRFVVDDVAASLAPWCTELHVPGAPSIVALRDFSHLGTLSEGRLRVGAPSALELAALLHPTPAVGGTPRQAALDWLAAHEGIDRGPFAGPVGWVDARGDGDWMVGIRSARIDGASARLYAGVGVVADSDPAAELAETQLKLQAVLAALVHP